MDSNRMDKIREIAQDIRRSRSGASPDYAQLTAPCGLPCFECYMHLAKNDSRLQALLSEEFGVPPEEVVCDGCRPNKGQCAHLPIKCNLYPCAESKGIEFCCDCSDFPCDLLHPYEDMARLWHNTKVFNLCLIKKMGLEKWAKDKAASVLDVYSHEQWRL